eukprot:2803055-Alexandrium_andersonii.AAC.1
MAHLHSQTPKLLTATSAGGSASPRGSSGRSPGRPDKDKSPARAPASPSAGAAASATASWRRECRLRHPSPARP